MDHTYSSFAILMLGCLIPTPWTPLVGMLPLGYALWNDRSASPRVYVVVVWIVWVLSDCTIPKLINDVTHTSDMALMLLSTIFFGLGYHKSLDDKTYRAAIITLVILCMLPTHGNKTMIEFAWSSIIYVFLVCAAWYVDKESNGPLHIAAQSCWILFVRCDPPYLVSAVVYMLYFAKLVRAKFDTPQPIEVRVKLDTPPPIEVVVVQVKEQTKPTRQTNNENERRRMPKPTMTRRSLFTPTTQQTTFDPEAMNVEPFRFGKN